MNNMSKSALVSYTPAEMYALVNDVARYPEFLPWCRSTSVLRSTPDEMEARIEMARGAMHKSFVTLNRLDKDRAIEMRLVEGPFRHLHGSWRFEPLGERACKVSLEMKFDFSSKVLALLIGPVFSHIVDTLVDAFHARAQDVYGKR